MLRASSRSTVYEEPSDVTKHDIVGTDVYMENSQEYNLNAAYCVVIRFMYNERYFCGIAAAL